MNKRLENIWDTLVDLGVATDAELGLAMSLCGVSEHTLNDVLYIRTGYSSLEQLYAEMAEEQEC